MYSVTNISQKSGVDPGFLWGGGATDYMRARKLRTRTPKCLSAGVQALQGPLKGLENSTAF